VFALILVYLIVEAIFGVMKVLLSIPDQLIRFHLELHFINRCLNFCKCSQIQLISTLALNASM
jgi:hypothetical protein